MYQVNHSLTLANWHMIIPESRRFVPTSDARDRGGTIQTMTSYARKLADCSVMITTAAHAQRAPGNDRKRCAIDHWPGKEEG